MGFRYYFVGDLLLLLLELGLIHNLRSQMHVRGEFDIVRKDIRDLIDHLKPSQACQESSKNIALQRFGSDLDGAVTTESGQAHTEKQLAFIMRQIPIGSEGGKQKQSMSNAEQLAGSKEGDFRSGCGGSVQDCNLNAGLAGDEGTAAADLPVQSLAADELERKVKCKNLIAESAPLISESVALDGSETESNTEKSGAASACNRKYVSSGVMLAQAEDVSSGSRVSAGVETMCERICSGVAAGVAELVKAEIAELRAAVAHLVPSRAQRIPHAADGTKWPDRAKERITPSAKEELDELASAGSYVGQTSSLAAAAELLQKQSCSEVMAENALSEPRESSEMTNVQKNLSQPSSRHVPVAVNDSSPSGWRQQKADAAAEMEIAAAAAKVAADSKMQSIPSLPKIIAAGSDRAAPLSDSPVFSTDQHPSSRYPALLHSSQLVPGAGHTVMAGRRSAVPSQQVLATRPAIKASVRQSPAAAGQNDSLMPAVMSSSAITSGGRAHDRIFTHVARQDTKQNEIPRLVQSSTRNRPVSGYTTLQQSPQASRMVKDATNHQLPVTAPLERLAVVDIGALLL